MTAPCAPIFDFGAADTLAFRAEMDALPITERTRSPFSSVQRRTPADTIMGTWRWCWAWPQTLHSGGASALTFCCCFSPPRKRPAEPDGFAKQGLGASARQSRICPAPLARSFCRDDRRFARRHDGALGRGDVHRRGRCAHFCSAASGRDALAACVSFTAGPRHCRFRRLRKVSARLRAHGGQRPQCSCRGARLEGSLRALDDAAFAASGRRWRSAAMSRKPAGCAAAVHFSEGYPAVVNPPDLLLPEPLRCSHIEALTAPTMARSDDFSYYQRRLPGCFLFLGCGGDIGAARTAVFGYGERVLETGVRFISGAVAGGTVW